MADEENKVVAEQEPKTSPFDDEEIEFGEDKSIDEFGLIDENDYEVELENIEKKSSNKNGKVTEWLNITFKIRDDVDQQFQGRKIWYSIFKRDNDKAYNFNRINKIIVTQKERSDYKRHFNNLDEILQYLVGLHLRLKITVEFNDFKGEDGNKVDEDSFAPSIWDTQDHAAPKKEEGLVEGHNLDQLDTPDDDLPF